MLLHSEINSSERTYKRRIETGIYDKTDIIENIKRKIYFIFQDNNIETTMGINNEEIENHINHLVDVAKQRIKVQCLHETAFVFSYCILKKTGDTYSIDTTKLKHVLTEYAVTLRNDGVDTEDLIRYARFWASFVFNKPMV